MFAEQVKFVYETMSPAEPQEERLFRMIASAVNHESQTHAVFHPRGFRKATFSVRAGLPMYAPHRIPISSSEARPPRMDLSSSAIKRYRPYNDRQSIHLFKLKFDYY